MVSLFGSRTYSKRRKRSSRKNAQNSVKKWLIFFQIQQVRGSEGAGSETIPRSSKNKVLKYHLQNASNSP